MSLNPIGKKQKLPWASSSCEPTDVPTLPQSFFARPTLEVCADLLGKQLCRRLPDGQVTAGYISEVEGYFGFDDKASHAYKNTPRSQVMFGPAGYWYVYLCYGVHEMLNIVTEKDGFPAAILIRGLHHVSGPGRLTQTLQIDRQFNKTPADSASDLWIAPSPLALSRKDYTRTPRIGVDYAGPIWAKKPFRFLANPDRLQKQLSQVMMNLEGA